MFRTFQLCLLLLGTQVCVDADLEKDWRRNNKPYFSDVQNALNRLLKKDEQVTVNQFKLRMEDRKQGVVIGNSVAGKFSGFYVDGIGIHTETRTFVIKQIRTKTNEYAKLKQVENEIQRLEKDSVGALTLPSDNSDLRDIDEPKLEQSWTPKPKSSREALFKIRKKSFSS